MIRVNENGKVHAVFRGSILTDGISAHIMWNYKGDKKIKPIDAGLHKLETTRSVQDIKQHLFKVNRQEIEDFYYRQKNLIDVERKFIDDYTKGQIREEGLREVLNVDESVLRNIFNDNSGMDNLREFMSGKVKNEVLKRFEINRVNVEELKRFMLEHLSVFTKKLVFWDPNKRDIIYARTFWRGNEGGVNTETFRLTSEQRKKNLNTKKDKGRREAAEEEEDGINEITRAFAGSSSKTFGWKSLTHISHAKSRTLTHCSSTITNPPLSMPSRIDFTTKMKKTRG